jgi:hypothetical protein
LPYQGNFDVEFSPSGQVTHRIDYAAAHEVVGSERLIYDHTQELICTLVFDRKGLKINKTDFEYDPDGREVGWITRDASGALTSRAVEKYEGDLLVFLAIRQANGSPVREKIFNYVNNKIRKTVGTYYGFTGDISHRWVSTYDFMGRIAETFGVTKDGKPLGDGKYLYEYDSEGRESKVWSFNDCSEENTTNAVRIHEYSCDELGNWTERRDFHRFRSDSDWRKTTTTRKLTYYSSL